jgi:hypothetical protein
MYLHTLSFVRTMACSSPPISTWKTPSAWDTTFHTSRPKHTGQRGPCTSRSLSLVYHLFRLTTNSILAQTFHSISSLTAHSSRNRITGLRWPTFPFYLTSPPAAGIISNSHPLPWRAFMRHSSVRPCQRQHDACSLPSAGRPTSPVTGKSG